MIATPTISSHVRVALLLTVALSFGCAQQDRPGFYHPTPNTTQSPATSCSTPARGCPCDTPGRLVECGEVETRADSYVTCTEGVRVCGDDGSWGECQGELVVVPTGAGSGKKVAALGAPEACSEQNPCDPLCRQIVDTGANLTGLPEGLCSTPTGLGICPRCGYTGKVANLPYLSMPTEWRTVPGSCSPNADTCPFDLACIDGQCRTRTAPCATADATCTTDLTLGKPCFDPSSPNTTYHIPLCNRGSSALTGATIRIGVDSRAGNVASCLPLNDTPANAGFPDRGVVEFRLAAGQSLRSGACIDINSSNSVASADFDLLGHRALVANIDQSVSECNVCNNGTAAIYDSDGDTYSTCLGCENLECSQTNSSTTLRGVLYDPAGLRPVPNAIIYVPNGEVAPLVDEAACDECNEIVSGHPVTWTRTDATGHFVLSDLPSEVEFPLVAQVGRWRRQYRVDAVPSGRTCWVSHYDVELARLRVTADANEPAPNANAQLRLRLPATQRRCVGTQCGGEGDIPRTALFLGDGDSVQCALRRIGIDDGEFGNHTQAARVHLFEGTGMHVVGSRNAFGSGGVTESLLPSGLTALTEYSLLVAPCDGLHHQVGDTEYASRADASGPSFNGWPDPTAAQSERANVKAFLEAGGRLLATHWLAMDFVHLNYSPGTRALFAPTDASPLRFAFEPDGYSGLSEALAAYVPTPYFSWDYSSADDERPDAPALFQFGNAIRAGGNVDDPNGGRYPAMLYGFEVSDVEGARLSTWATAVGAAKLDGSGTPRLPWQQWSPMVRAVRGSVTGLLSGDSTVGTDFAASSAATPVPQQPCLEGGGAGFDCESGRTWGSSHWALLQFDAPLESEAKCGRAGIVSGHVGHQACYSPSGSRAAKYCANMPPFGDGNPPPDCDCLAFPEEADRGCGSSSDMSPEELAFEYLLFSTSQCVGELWPPPSAPSLPTEAFVRDFEADCDPKTELAVWKLFSWQATIPEGTQITFLAASADTQGELDAAGFTYIGSADQSTTTWTTGARTVDNALRADPAHRTASRRWLRIKAVFEPNRGASPTLSEWRVVFNCADN